MGKKPSYQQVVLGSLDIHMHSHVKEWSLTPPYFRAYTKINSKWIKKKICINVGDYGLGNSLTLTTQKEGNNWISSG